MCTTEIIAFSKAYPFFKKINTELLGLSIDSNSSHLAWIYDIYLKYGVRINFPIIADRSGEIARKYGMISNDISNTETVRNVYIINPNGVVKLILSYPMNIGRNISEILRSVYALQMSEENQVFMPANWVPCGPVIKPMPNNYLQLEERVNNKSSNDVSWYLGYERIKKCNENIFENIDK